MEKIEGDEKGKEETIRVLTRISGKTTKPLGR